MRRVFVMAAFGALVFGVRGAAAQTPTHQGSEPRDERRAPAETLFKEALKLHKEHRDAEAIEKYKQAYALLPAPNALYFMARSEHDLGRHVAAIRHYREALKNPILDPNNAKLASEYVKQLEAVVARVLVTGPDGTKITLVDREFRLPMEEPYDLDPTTLSLRGDRDGERYVARGEAVSGKLVTIALKRVDAPPVVSPVAPPVAAPATDPGWPAGRYAGISVMGGGIAALVTGAVFAVRASDGSDEVARLEGYAGEGEAMCNGASRVRSCDELRSRREERDDNATLSTAFLIGGGVALAAGALWFVLSPTKASRVGAAATPLLGLRSSGFRLQF